MPSFLTFLVLIFGAVIGVLALVVVGNIVGRALLLFQDRLEAWLDGWFPDA